jgi:Flp pilus assembly protein TadD
VKKSLENQNGPTQRRKVAKVAKQTKQLWLSGLCALAPLREAVHFFHGFSVASWLILWHLLSLGALSAAGVRGVPTVDSPIEQAKACLERGQSQEAQALLSQFLKGNPENFEAYRLLAAAYVRSQQYAEAVTQLERAVQLKPDSPEAWKELGETYSKLQKPDKATSAFLRSVALKPDQPPTQYALGMLFLDARDYRQAAAHLEQARAFGLKHSGVLLNLGRAYLNLKRIDEALETLNQLRLASSRDWRLQLDIGTLLFENLLYQDAKEPLDLAWELNHDSYGAGFYVALNHFMLGEQAECLKVLQELRAKGARTREVGNLLGCVYAKLGQTDEATKVLKQAMEEAPDQPDAYFNLGLILLEQGKRKEAEASLERAGALYRGDAKIFYMPATQQACREARQILDQGQQATKPDEPSRQRSSFYRQMGEAFEQRFHYTSAAELLHIAWELDPNNAETVLSFGISCFNLDDLFASLTLFRRAVELQPHSDQAYYFLGGSYANLGRDSEAIEAYRQAIRLDPKNPSYHHRLGKLYGRNGHTAEALASYEAALALSPDDAATHSALGKLYLRLGKDEQAVSELHEAIRLNPNLAEPYYYFIQYYTRNGQADEAQKFTDAFARKSALARRTPGQFAYVRARE